MRKIIVFSLLALLFASCEKEEEPTIYGKWKLEYAKNIDPAIYDEIIGIPLYDEDATIIEYFGGYNGTRESIPQTGGLTYKGEYMIEFGQDGFINLYIANFDASTDKIDTLIERRNYIIGDEYFHMSPREEPQFNPYNQYGYCKYTLKKKTLIIETAWPIYTTGFDHLREANYRYAKYSRVK